MSKHRLRWWIARSLLAVTGWKPEGDRPDSRHCVLIAAPHTSNWDFAYLLIFAAYFDLEVHWMGKHKLFRPPFGGIMKALGGIPIVRELRENVVSAMVRSLREHTELILVVPAEGTRSHRDYWRSGFYHIALDAEVPIVMSYLDYAQKRGGFGPAFHPSGDVRKDMDRVRAFYAGKEGKHPERFGPIRLREEDSHASPPGSNPSSASGRPDARSPSRSGAEIHENR
jgi:1-acyl-sn-glycerol-3-phosphate acyltransferase